jgi:hypothetical protein
MVIPIKDKKVVKDTGKELTRNELEPERIRR